MLFVRQTRHRMWAAARCPDCGEHPGYGDMCPPRPRRPVTLPPPSQSQLLPSHGKLFCHMRPQKRLKIGSITYCKHSYNVSQLLSLLHEWQRWSSWLQFWSTGENKSHYMLHCIVSFFVRHRYDNQTIRSWRVMSRTHFVPTESCRPVNICANQIIYWAR